jgi:hypothetical protein
LSGARTAAIWNDFASSFSDAVLTKCHSGGTKNVCTPKTPPRLERSIAKKRLLRGMRLKQSFKGNLQRGASDNAMDYLRRAIDAGYKDLRAFSNDEDLLSLRSRPDFKELQVRSAC